MLKKGIHLRTHIPGIPEIDLFNWLCSIAEDHSDVMSIPSLYPGIDTYDIRIEFTDEAWAWAIDVKDYADPFQLADNMRGIMGRGLLAYKRGIYVYPNYRTKHRKDYHQILHEKSLNHRKGAHILSDDQLKQEVMKHIDTLKDK